MAKLKVKGIKTAEEFLDIARVEAVESFPELVGAMEPSEVHVVWFSNVNGNYRCSLYSPKFGENKVEVTFDGNVIHISVYKRVHYSVLQDYDPDAKKTEK